MDQIDQIDEMDEIDQIDQKDALSAMRKLDYQTLFKKLNELGIDYLLVGGLAVNFHGIPGMTYDIHLLISLQPENILKLVGQLTQWGYRPKIAVDPKDLADEATRNSWIEDKGLNCKMRRSLRFPSQTSLKIPCSKLRGMRSLCILRFSQKAGDLEM